ncbi:MAG: hypothetical protein O3B70_07185 [Bacteroidetes bacterium]|nr:hypothetical protein [Bacteroidota bacterium]MDA1243130.1 hypothetical protein [Bacteroidota bacterium]
MNPLPTLSTGLLTWVLVMSFCGFFHVNSQAQTSSDSQGWSTYQPTSVGHSWEPNGFQGTSFDLKFSSEWNQPIPQSMMPPDPNSQIPLTGFDYMLMASFAFGVWWIVRQRGLAAPMGSTN